MSAEKIPAAYHCKGYMPDYQAGGDCVNCGRVREDHAGFSDFADRSTRPAEPAPEVEVGEVVAWAKPRGPWVVGEKFIWDEDRNEDWMKGVFTDPLVRRSTLEAERARADAADQRAEIAEALVVLDEATVAAAQAEAAELRAALSRALQENQESYELGKRDGYEQAVQRLDELTGGDGEFVCVVGGDPESRHCPDATSMQERIVARFSRTLQDRDEAVRVAVEDERDRLYALAEEKDAELRAFGPVSASNLLRRQGALMPDVRAGYRADQRAGDGGGE